MVEHNENFPVPEKYLKAKRAAIESLYCGTLTATVKQEQTDKKTHITTFEEVTVLKDIPCRLSQQTIKSTTNDGPAVKAKTIRVFLAPEIEIPAGSKLIISQHGKTGVYKQSGEPYFKSDSQTIELEFEAYA